MFKRTTYVVFTLMLLASLFSPAFAGQKLINLQGKLTDPTSSYAPITGGHELYFRLYDSSTSANVLWMEHHHVDLPANGVFNVVLGSSVTLDTYAFNKQYYVGIVVDGGVDRLGNVTYEMTPRQPLTATPYSLGSISDMNIGKDLYVVGNSSVTGNSIVKGGINVSSNAVINGTLTISSNTVMMGNATIKGNASITGNFMSENLYTSSSGFITSNNILAYGAGKDLNIMHGGNGYGDIVFGTQINTERMRIKNSGDLILFNNVGIGIASPGGRLDINGPMVGRNYFHITNGVSGSDVHFMTWTATDNGIYMLFNNGAPRVRLIASGNSYFNGGNLGIGMTNPTHILDVAGDAYAQRWVSWSDERLKKDIVNYADSQLINKVNKLQAIKYKIDKDAMRKITDSSSTVSGLSQDDDIDKYGYCDVPQIGLSAQSLEAQFPELVVTDKNGNKGIEYGRLSVILLEAMKEQQKKIENLESRLAAFESRN